MRYVAWLWCLLMLGGALLVASQGDALGMDAAPNLVLGMVFSAALLLPPLWSDGAALASLGVPAPSRAILAFLIPLICASAGTPFGLDSFARPPVASA